MRSAVLYASFVVLGCGGSTPAPAPTTPAPPTGAPEARAACASAIGKAAVTGRGDEVFSPEDQAFSAAIEVAMTDGCVATQWPAVVLQCLSYGTTREELRPCTEMLTPVQREDFMERVLVVTKAHEAKVAPAP